MPQDKARTSVRVRRPQRIQDSSGLERHLLSLVDATIINPILDRLTTLERAVAGLGGLEVGVADLDLARSASGSTILDGTFGEARVGAPVIVVQGPRSDDAEFGILAFVGEVIDPTRLRVTWWAASNHSPDRVRVHYIIGTFREGG